MEKEWKNSIKDQKKIIKYANKMNKDNYQSQLDKIYQYIKEKQEKYYISSKMHEAYNSLKMSVLESEMRYPYLKYLDIPYDFDLEDYKDTLIYFVVHESRKELLYLCTHGKMNMDLNEISLTNYCRTSANIVKSKCKEHHIDCYVIPIYPGFCKEAKLYRGSGFHFVNIIKYQKEYYLVDLTYSQFFYQRKNNLNRIGIIDLEGAHPGVFMLMSSEGKELATSIIREGYALLDEHTLKMYLDPFAISYRNGLYYEDTQDFSYTTKYTAHNYIDFLKGKDNQLKHESKMHLGFQKRP